MQCGRDLTTADRVIHISKVSLTSSGYIRRSLIAFFNSNYNHHYCQLASAFSLTPKQLNCQLKCLFSLFTVRRNNKDNRNNNNNTAQIKTNKNNLTKTKNATKHKSVILSIYLIFCVSINSFDNYLIERLYAIFLQLMVDIATGINGASAQLLAVEDSGLAAGHVITRSQSMVEKIA